MTPDSFLAVACASLIAFMFGLVLCFGGYRFFLILLPIWGFFFGLVFGAQSMQLLFGVGFFATVTSWVVGFVVGAVFAVLSYFFYLFAVALIAGGLGYAATVGLLLAIGLDMGFLVWIIGMAAAIALAFVTIRYNLQKWVIIIATSLAGAGVIFGAFVILFAPHAALLENPVKVALQQSPLLMITALIVAAFGIFVQARANRNYTLESYNRWAEPV
jgi:glucan phosphoethanolaminetransferase (alkaline phosphatase superfamily)